MNFRILPVLVLAVVLVGCVKDRKGIVFADATASLPRASRLDPAQENLVKAQEHFRNENYGLAENLYRKAIEQNPHNGDAWVGLAASYDRLRRFELAERAYGVVVKKVGYTINVHNNLGYHHYLRGNLAKARKHFDAAHEIDPTNPYVLNNLKLIDSS